MSSYLLSAGLSIQLELSDLSVCWSSMVPLRRALWLPLACRVLVARPEGSDLCPLYWADSLDHQEVPRLLDLIRWTISPGISKLFIPLGYKDMLELKIGIPFKPRISVKWLEVVQRPSITWGRNRCAVKAHVLTAYIASCHCFAESLLVASLCT